MASVFVVTITAHGKCAVAGVDPVNVDAFSQARYIGAITHSEGISDDFMSKDHG